MSFAFFQLYCCRFLASVGTRGLGGLWDFGPDISVIRHCARPPSTTLNFETTTKLAGSADWFELETRQSSSIISTTLYCGSPCLSVPIIRETNSLWYFLPTNLDSALNIRRRYREVTQNKVEFCDTWTPSSPHSPLCMASKRKLSDFGASSILFRRTHRANCWKVNLHIE